VRAAPHVLLARQDNDGDVLLAGPALRAAAAGAREVTLLVGPRGAQAGALLPGADRLLVEEAAWIDAHPAPVERARIDAFVDRLAALEVDVAIVLTSFHQSPLPLALLLRLAGVPRIAAISSDYPGSLLDVRHRVPDDLHEVDRALSLAEAAGHTLPASDPPALRVELSSPPPPLPDEPFFAIHPGASVPARAWEPDAWARLVDILDERGHRVVVTGGAEESELTLRVVAGRPGVLDLGGCCGFDELGAVLARAEAVAVANTGPAHLAAAVGTPVASLYAPTVPWVRWRPWGVPHELLYREVPCAGCRARRCFVPGHPCLGEVEPSEVADALERLAATRSHGRERAGVVR
jgi:ADP-heptose:LPS heptosyltransferase